LPRDAALQFKDLSLLPVPQQLPKGVVNQGPLRLNARDILAFLNENLVQNNVSASHSHLLSYT
jgi:hypothetical protein